MGTSYKFNLIKAAFLISYLIFFLLAGYAWAQPNQDCGELSFKTEVLKFELKETCYHVALEVSNNGNSQFELSHVNFDFGGGTVSNASNSMDWPMALNNTDPTTGIGGLKVDDIINFGKDPELISFLLEFTFCPDEKWSEEDNSFTPVIAYKAGQCVYYENPEIELEEPSGEDPGDEGPVEGEEPEGEQTELIISINKTDPSCNNDAEGSIELTVIEGTSPYEILWNTGQAEFVLQSLSAGSYTYTVTDASGKQASGEVILESPAHINIMATITDSDCQGANNGSIDIAIEGGNAPYTFLWSNGSTSQNLTNLYAGPYFVQVTDATGCSSEKTISILNTISIQAEATISHPSCQKGTLGNIVISATGGAEPYSFSWSNGMEGSSIDGLTDRYYRVTITDQGGCSYSKTYSIVTDVGIVANATITKTNCFDDAAGEIDLTISGGTDSYTIEWSNGASTEDLVGLVSGDYTATITDALGCQIDFKTTLSKDDIIINYENMAIPSCNGSVNGAVSISVSNGTEPYTFSWSNGSSDEDINNLPSGKYTVEVTDDKGCIAQKAFNLPEPAPIQISYEIVSETCSESQEININASGGSMEYTYSWSDGSTSSQLSNATSGTYTVTVTDSKSCTATQEIVVEELAELSACLIQDLTSEVVCGSTGNVMMSSTPDAISYSWTISSSDNSWAISSASDQAQIQYNAGSAGSNATFTLTVQYEGACENVCEQTIDVCNDNDTPDNNPDNNPDDETTDDETTDEPNVDDETIEDDDNWNENKDCDKCFYTKPIVIRKAEQGYSYTIEVSHDDCRYELSHMTIEIPTCFTILDYSNSMNWKMERINHDPATGISGIKIDDIPSFGKDEYNTSFMIYLNLIEDDPGCMDDILCFAPAISYKAATCVYEEQTQSECLEEYAGETIVTYPNPTQDYLKVNIDKYDPTVSYTVDLLNMFGEKIDSFLYQKGTNMKCIFDLSPMKDGLYFVDIKGSNGYRRTQKVLRR